MTCSSSPKLHLTTLATLLIHYRMKLNPLKCTFGVAPKNFLVYGQLMGHRGQSEEDTSLDRHAVSKQKQGGVKSDRKSSNPQ